MRGTQWLGTGRQEVEVGDKAGAMTLQEAIDSAGLPFPSP